MKRLLPLALAVLAAACGGRSGVEMGAAPVPGSAPEALNALWTQATDAFRHGKWGDAQKRLTEIVAQSPPGDPRVPKAYFYLAETHFARSEHLDAVRYFRRVSDEYPNDPLAPDALLRAGDAYAALWGRPELDPSYGQTALATYQELASRYPGTPAAAKAQQKVRDLEEKFATKQYKSALFYFRYKAYDSAIIYLRDLVANYPRSSVAPEALLKLIEAYQRLGYLEDIRETCGYIRRFHPTLTAANEVCPADLGGTT